VPGKSDLTCTVPIVLDTNICLPNGCNPQIPHQGIFYFLVLKYFRNMNILPALKTGKIIVTFGPHTILPALLAELALRGPLTVLDGGNRFPAYRIVQEIRRRSVDVTRISEQLFLRRAFTAYQIVHMLESASAERHPLILLDLLSTFQDDQIQPHEADRLLSTCISHIQRLSVSAPIALYLTPYTTEEKSFLLERLCQQADELFAQPDALPPAAAQLSLF